LLAPGDRIYYETHYAPLLQMQGAVREIAVEIVRANGDRLPALMNSVLKKDAAGTPLLSRTTVFDATDRRKYERELLRAREQMRAQNERLREVDRLKDELVSLVSHEFRTPLTSIRSYVELLLEDGGLDAKQVRFLQVVERNSGRLLRLVNDLLLAVQADAGRLALTYSSVDPRRLVAECLQTVAPAVEAKQLAVDVAAEPVAPIEADAERLAQLLDNLLTNAIKFTPSGGSIGVSVSGDDGSVVFEVRDSGTGIPADQQAHIFDRFYRADAARKQAIAGSGLGLAVARAIVDAHHGGIAVQSENANGTTVRVELPRRQPRRDR